MRWKGGLEDIGWVKRGGITMLETRDGGESGTLYVAVIFYDLSRITLPSRVNLLWLMLQAVPVPFQPYCSADFLLDFVSLFFLRHLKYDTLNLINVYASIKYTYA